MKRKKKLLIALYVMYDIYRGIAKLKNVDQIFYQFYLGNVKYYLDFFFGLVEIIYLILHTQI